MKDRKARRVDSKRGAKGSGKMKENNALPRSDSKDSKLRGFHDARMSNKSGGDA